MLIGSGAKIQFYRRVRQEEYRTRQALVEAALDGARLRFPALHDDGLAFIVGACRYG